MTVDRKMIQSLSLHAEVWYFIKRHVSPQLWYEEWSIWQVYFQNFITRIVGKLGVTFPIAGIRPLKAVHLTQNALSR